MVRFKAARVFSLAYLSRNWRHNFLNAKNLYGSDCICLRGRK